MFRLGTTPIIAAVVLATIALPVTSAASTTTTQPPTPPSTTTTQPPTAPTVPVREVNPFTLPVVKKYLATRGDVTAAIYDVNSRKTYLYRPGIRQPTASMIKINILALLLYQSQQSHHPLSPEIKETATEMIEYSDNDAATDLWNDVGAEPAIAAFDARIGYTQTLPNVDWGEVETTPTDQLKLLKVITLPNKFLDPASQHYEQYLMEHIVSYESFGIGDGTPAPAVTGFKNGWYPETSGWQTNTSGYVHAAKRFYLVTIMTARNSSETYGTDTLTTLANLIYRTLKP